MNKDQLNLLPAALFSSVMAASSSWTRLMFWSLSSATKATCTGTTSKAGQKTSQHQQPDWCYCMIYLCEQLLRFVLPNTTLLLDLLCITIPLFLQMGYRFQQLQNKNIESMIKTALAGCDISAPTRVQTWWLCISSCCFSSNSDCACWLALVGSDWLEHWERRTTSKNVIEWKRNGYTVC